MSVFGGDSWGRDAQQRKRRVDDLILDEITSNSHKKLCNGKYVCLVCPNNPLFDSPLMLSMHNKGLRHIAAESRLKERELMREEEIKKRIALSDGSATSLQHLKGKAWIQRTLKAAAEALSSEKAEQLNVKKKNAPFFSPNASCAARKVTQTSQTLDSGPCLYEQPRASVKMVVGECRERELKFTAAGWKRDGHGRWFRDENVEFDSDEEDPNICLL